MRGLFIILIIANASIGWSQCGPIYKYFSEGDSCATSYDNILLFAENRKKDVYMTTVNPLVSCILDDTRFDDIIENTCNCVLPFSVKGVRHGLVKKGIKKIGYSKRTKRAFIQTVSGQTYLTDQFYREIINNHTTCATFEVDDIVCEQVLDCIEPPLWSTNYLVEGADTIGEAYSYRDLAGNVFNSTHIYPRTLYDHTELRVLRFGDLIKLEKCIDRANYGITCDTIDLVEESAVYDYLNIVERKNGDSIYFVMLDPQGLPLDTTAIIHRDKPIVGDDPLEFCTKWTECFSFDEVCVQDSEEICDTTITATRVVTNDTLLTKVLIGLDCDTTFTPIDTIETITCDSMVVPDSVVYIGDYCCDRLNRFRISHNKGATWSLIGPGQPFDGFANSNVFGNYYPYNQTNGNQFLMCQVVGAYIPFYTNGQVNDCYVNQDTFGFEWVWNITSNFNYWVEARYEEDTANCSDFQACFNPGKNNWQRILTIDSTGDGVTKKQVCDTTFKTIYDTIIACDSVFQVDTFIFTVSDTIIYDTTIECSSYNGPKKCCYVLRDSLRNIVDTVVCNQFGTCDDVLECLSDTAYISGDSAVIVSTDGDTLKLGLSSSGIDSSWVVNDTFFHRSVTGQITKYFSAPGVTGSDSAWVVLDTFFHRDLDGNIVSFVANEVDSDSSWVIANTFFHRDINGAIVSFTPQESQSDTSWVDSGIFYHVDADGDTTTYAPPGGPADTAWVVANTFNHRDQDGDLVSFTPAPQTHDTVYFEQDTVVHRTSDGDIVKFRQGLGSDTSWVNGDTLFHIDADGDTTTYISTSVENKHDSLTTDQGKVIYNDLDDLTNDTIEYTIDRVIVDTGYWAVMELNGVRYDSIFILAKSDTLWADSISFWHVENDGDSVRVMFPVQLNDTAYISQDTFIHISSTGDTTKFVASVSQSDTAWIDVDTLFHVDADGDTVQFVRQNHITDSVWVSGDTLFHRDIDGDIIFFVRGNSTSDTSWVDSGVFFHIDADGDTTSYAPPGGAADTAWVTGATFNHRDSDGDLVSFTNNDDDATNEFQTLSLLNNMLEISDGNSVDLSQYGNVTGNGVANRVAYWVTPDSLGHDGDFTFDGTKATIGDIRTNDGIEYGTVGESWRSGNDVRHKVNGSSGFHLFYDHNDQLMFHLYNTTGDARVYNNLGVGGNATYKADVFGNMRIQTQLGLNGRNPDVNYAINANGRAIFWNGGDYVQINHTGELIMQRTGLNFRIVNEGSVVSFRTAGLNALQIQTDQDVVTKEEHFVEGKLVVNAGQTNPSNRGAVIRSDDDTRASLSLSLQNQSGTESFGMRGDHYLDGAWNSLHNSITNYGLQSRTWVFPGFEADPNESNMLFLADERFSVTATNTTNALYNFWFDKGYSVGACDINASSTSVININWDGIGGYSTNGLTHPSGLVYVTTYTGSEIDDVNSSIRAKDRDDVWHNGTFLGRVFQPSDNWADDESAVGNIYAFSMPSVNYAVEMELTLINLLGTNCRILSIEYYPKRTSTEPMPVLLKYRDETMWKGLTFNDEQDDKVIIDPDGSKVVTAKGDVLFDNGTGAFEFDETDGSVAIGDDLVNPYQFQVKDATTAIANFQSTGAFTEIGITGAGNSYSVIAGSDGLEINGPGGTFVELNDNGNLNFKYSGLAPYPITMGDTVFFDQAVLDSDEDPGNVNLFFGFKANGEPDFKLISTIDHDQLLNYDINEHRVMDDAQTTNTTLWSSNKIIDHVAAEILPKLDSLEQDLSPELGGNLDLTGFNFQMEFMAGATISIGDVVTMDTTKTDGEFVLADADTSALSVSQIGIAASAGTDGNSFKVVTYGMIGGLSGIVANQPYFLSTTDGTITRVPPTGTNTIVRIIGYGHSTTELFLDPGKTWVKNE